MNIRTGDRVRFYSNALQDWVRATVTDVVITQSGKQFLPYLYLELPNGDLFGVVADVDLFEQCRFRVTFRDGGDRPQQGLPLPQLNLY